MGVTRYSATSVSIGGGGTGLTLVGGASCLNDETDHSTYLDWVYPGSGTNSFRAEFGVIPGLTQDSRLMLHIVGTGGPTDPYGYDSELPVFIDDSIGGFGHRLFTDFRPVLVGLTFEATSECCLPYLPFNGSINFADSLGLVSDSLTGFFDFRIYGAYLTVQDGLTSGAALDGVPYVTFGMYGGGLVTLDAAGAPLSSTGNEASGKVGSFAAWTDGSIAMPRTILNVPFAVLQPQGSEIYSMAVPEGAMAALYVPEGSAAGGTGLSLVPLDSSGTVMVTWVDPASGGNRVVFWEFNRDGVQLHEWLPTFPPHTTTGLAADNWYPQSGGRFGDKFIFNGASHGTQVGRVNLANGSGNYGGDVMVMDLTTGAVSTLISDAQIGAHAGVGLGSPNFGNPALGAICVDPDDGDIYLYLCDGGYDNARNDAQMWISRWGIDGSFKGKIGFNDDHVGSPFVWDVFVYDGGGGITCCDDGRLIFFYSGAGPNLSALGGNEYDGLLQLNKSAVPSDGSTAYAVPIPFWRSPGGTIEGIGGNVTKMMTLPSVAPTLKDVRVRFS